MWFLAPNSGLSTPDSGLSTAGCPTDFAFSVFNLIFAIPVFFAGLLFASEFRSVESPAAALGANMLGAVVGGLLENLSLIIGMKALLLVAALLYSLAALGFLGLPSRRAAALNQP